MMIISPDGQPSEKAPDPKFQGEKCQAGPDEPPPSYSPPTEPFASGNTSPPPTFQTKPTNFLSLATGNNSINGEFVIDPSIRIPPHMLPPLGEGETEDVRKNLSLTSKYSLVQADIWLLGLPFSGESQTRVYRPRRTTIVLTSDYESIHAQLHTLDGAAPFSLTARAGHGTIELALPRSFQGILLLSTSHGSISLSDPLVQNATQLSQLEKTRRYFVGDFNALGDSEWEGDQVEIDAPYGSLRLKYVNELTETQDKKGFFSQLFGT